MNFKRIARALVCLVLVCALVVNISPIKTEAIVAEAVATYLGYGIVAALVLGTAGFVISPTGQDQLENLGHAFQTSMYQWGTSAEKLEEVEEFFAGLTLYNGGTGSGDDDDDIDHRFKIPEAIRRGVAAFTAAAILAGSLVVPEKTLEAPNGYTFYGEHCLVTAPAPSDTLPYTCLCYSPGDVNFEYWLFCGTAPFDIYFSNNKNYWLDSNSDPFVVYVLDDAADLQWFKATNDDSSEYIGSYQVVWANHDIVDDSNSEIIRVEGSAASSIFTETTTVEPDIYVGDIPDKVKDGTITEETLELPMWEIDYTKLATANPDLAVAVTDLLQNVASGSITYEDYLNEFAPAVIPDPDPEPEPEPDPTTGADDLILGDIKTSTFFETLTDVVTAPFKWIWEKLDTKLDILKPPEFDFDKLTSIVTAPSRWIWEKLETVVLPAIRAIPDKLLELGTLIESIPGIITDKMAEIGAQTKAAIEALVVPDEDYLTDKVNALCEEFAFADSIVKTAKELKVGLAGVTTEPPVIYINLGATRGSYDIGGVVPFIDMRWYAEYKPTADALISAFLWICFIWRMLIHLPGIISGASGLFNITPMPSTHTSPIGAFKGNNSLSAVDPKSGMTYGEMLNLYHEDLYDNPWWEKHFGRNPSFSTLQELYDIDPD